MNAVGILGKMNAVGILGTYISQGVYTVAAPFHPFGGAVDIIVVQQADGTFRSSPWSVKFGKFQGVLKGKEKIVDVAVNDVQANFHMYLDNKGEAFFLKDMESDYDDTFLSPPSAPSSGDETVEFRENGDGKGDSMLDGSKTQERHERLGGADSEVAGASSGITEVGICTNSSKAGEPEIEQVVSVSSCEANPVTCDLVTTISETDRNEVETEDKNNGSLKWKGKRSQISSNSVPKPAGSIIGLDFGGVSQGDSSMSMQKAKQPRTDDFQRLSSLERAEIVTELFDRQWCTNDRHMPLTATDMMQIALSAAQIGLDGPQSTKERSTAAVLEGPAVAIDDTFTLKTEQPGELAQEILESEFEGYQHEKIIRVNTAVENLGATIMRLENCTKTNETTEVRSAEEGGYLQTAMEEHTTVLLLDVMKLPNDNADEDGFRNGQYEGMDAAMIQAENSGDQAVDSNNSEVVLMSIDGHVMTAPATFDSDHSHVEEPGQISHDGNANTCTSLSSQDTRGEIAEFKICEHPSVKAGCTRMEQNVSDSVELVRIIEITADPVMDGTAIKPTEYVGRPEVLSKATGEHPDVPEFCATVSRVQVTAASTPGTDNFSSSEPVSVMVAADRTGLQKNCCEVPRSVMVMDAAPNSTRIKNCFSKLSEEVWLSEGSASFTGEEPYKSVFSVPEFTNFAQELSGSELTQASTTDCLSEKSEFSRRGQLYQEFPVSSESILAARTGDNFVVSNASESGTTLCTWEKHERSGCSEAHGNVDMAADTCEETFGLIENTSRALSTHNMPNMAKRPCQVEVENTETSGQSEDRYISEMPNIVQLPLQIETHRKNLPAGGLLEVIGQTQSISGGGVQVTTKRSLQFKLANDNSSDGSSLEMYGQLGNAGDSSERHADGRVSPGLERFHSFGTTINNCTDFETDEDEEELFKSCLALEDLFPAPENVEVKDPSGACNSSVNASSLASTAVIPEAVCSSGFRDEHPAADGETKLKLTEHSSPMSVPKKESLCWEEEDVRAVQTASSSLPARFFETGKYTNNPFHSHSLGTHPLLNTIHLPNTEAKGEANTDCSTNGIAKLASSKEVCISGEVLDASQIIIAGKIGGETPFGNTREFIEGTAPFVGGINSNAGIEISLCRHLLTEGMGIEAAEKVFASEKVSLEEFKCSGSQMSSNDKLVVKIGKQYFPWVAAAPVIIDMVAFGSAVPPQMEGAIAVEANEMSKVGEIASGAVVPSGGWSFWPFTSRRARMGPVSSAEVTSKALLAATEAAVQSPFTEELLRKNGYYKRSRKPKVQTNVPSSLQLASLNLKEGPNKVTFTFFTRVFGRQQVDARIYLWNWSTRIVVSDVDGTITKSDVLGQFMPLVGRDWSQSGVTRLFSAIKDNGYELLFLSARAISQAYLTRRFLSSLKQDGETLPDGPVVISPDGLFPSLYREVIRRAPHEFKISCLEGIRELFPHDVNPFYAGFGNRDTDEISYLKVGIPKGKIFIINPKGEVAVNHRVDVKSYSSLHTLVDDMFPAMSSFEQEDFNSWNYWKLPLSDISDELNEKNQRTKKGGESKR